MPLHAELVQRLPGPILLHICGNTADRIDYIARAGVAGFHVDTKVPCSTARQVACTRLALAGGVNNPQTLYAGTPADVRRDVAAALAARFEIVGPECAVPLNAPLSQMRALSDEFFAQTDFAG